MNEFNEIPYLFFLKQSNFKIIVLISQYFVDVPDSRNRIAKL